MSETDHIIRELRQRIAELEQLVFSLGDKLLLVACHLGRLSERPEARMR